jgi:hypothetical protein
MSSRARAELRVPAISELLELWDAARSVVIAHRAVMLVGAACPSLTPVAIAEMSLGNRDTLLLRWRRLLFGDAIEAIARCPHCGETVETRFPVATLGFEEPAMPEPQDASCATYLCEVGDWRVRYRVPTCADAVALADAERPDARALIQRCLIEASCREPLAESDVLPDAVLAVIAQGIVSADPQADILLDLACPACAHRWSAPLDTVAFLWTEISAWARRTLREVAVLARVFGWREADILSMSPQRRNDYLDLVGT